MTTAASAETMEVPSAAPVDRLHHECLAIIRRLEMLRRAGRSGPLAELRRLERLDDDDPPPEAFWDLVQAAGIRGDERERFWQGLLPMLVTCPHARGARPGRVLRRAGVSSARVERWLRLGARDARRELRKLLRRTDGVDFVRLSRLLWSWEQPSGDALRREFARDFFLERPTTAD
jgi:hypothetical protein